MRAAIEEMTLGVGPSAVAAALPFAVLPWLSFSAKAAVLGCRLLWPSAGAAP